MLTTVNASGNRARLEANGKFRIFPTDFTPFSAISTLWASEEVAPGGILTFSIDGDPGANAEFGSINLGQTGRNGSRTCASNMSFAFIDVEVSGLPAEGKVMIFLR